MKVTKDDLKERNAFVNNGNVANHLMSDVSSNTTMKLVLLLLLTLHSIQKSVPQDGIELELSTLFPITGENPIQPIESTTQSVELTPKLEPETDAPKSVCVNNAKFDLKFLDESTNNLIRRYGASKDEEICEIDVLVDQLIPEIDESTQFDLKNASQTDNLGKTIEIFQNILAKINQNNKVLEPIINKITPRMAPLIYQIQASPVCMSSIVHLLGGFRQNEIWALKFFDAAAKLPAGILEGHLSVVGDYEECIAAHSKGDGTHFTGKYCFMKPIIPHPGRKSPGASHVNISGSIQIPPALADDIVDFLDIFNGIFLRFGICIPSVCTPAEIEATVNSLFYPLLGIPIQIGPDCEQYTNENATEIYFSSNQYQKMAFWIFASLFSIGILASIVDGCSKRSCEKFMKSLPEKTDQNGNVVEETNKTKSKRSIPMRILLSFSILSNTKEMFKIDNKARFASVDFIRFLMLVEVMVMHQYYVGLGWSAWPVSSRLFAENSLFTSASSAIRYAFLRNIHNTDFFFALSGMLLTYSTLRALDRRNGSFNYVWYIVSMYLRFYPAVFGVILMYYLLPLFGSGPFWSLLDQYHVETCRRNLVPNLLSYNFYLLDLDEFTKHSMCNIASWWVTSCFHLVLLAPIIMLPMYPDGLLGFTWAIMIMVGGSLASVAHILIENVPFMNQVGAMNSILENSFYSIFYTWPFIHHIGPFVAGMLTGYLIRRSPKLWLGGRVGQLILSFIFIGGTVFSFSWTETMLRGGVELGDLITGPKTPSLESQIEVYLNITVGKLMFVSGFLWLFYLCCTNKAKWINEHLFTWPWLKPLYSLSMGLYLTNFIPPLYFTFSTRQLIEFNDSYVFKTLPASMMLTMILAYILHILFERPIMNLLKIIEG